MGVIIGRDVPWVTRWSSEVLLGARPCPMLQGRVALHQKALPGHGRPIFSENHFNRQRLSVQRMLCPMCGAPTPPDDRWTQTGVYVAAAALRAKGLSHLLPPTAALPDDQRVLNTGAIAPCHRACAELALQRCPHLSRSADTSLKRFPERWLVAPLVVAAGPRPPATGRSIPAIGFLQLYGLEPAAKRRVG
jgi:hypothetical protein